MPDRVEARPQPAGPPPPARPPAAPALEPAYATVIPSQHRAELPPSPAPQARTGGPVWSSAAPGVANGVPVTGTAASQAAAPWLVAGDGPLATIEPEWVDGEEVFTVYRPAAETAPSTPA